MEFFDKLGKKASEAYKVTADKTGKIAKETKLKFKIGELKTQINSIYEEIGKKVYEKHVREEICIKKDLEEQCTKIDVLSDEIDSLLKECLELKDKKQCQKCYKEIEKDDKFCPNCGEKQTEELAKEVEVLEKLEHTQVSNEKQNEKQVVEEELQQSVQRKENQEDDEQKSNLEKTVEVEANVKLEEQTGEELEEQMKEEIEEDDEE
ncbi:MAG: zinc ribbon domain-containing protein [Clostridia bacterium]|nr:zinc ribbon domain-containing protein [Clostridia bacterium]